MVTVLQPVPQPVPQPGPQPGLQPGPQPVPQPEDVDRRGVAWEIAACVLDPELPVVTLADLGVLRSVEVTADTVEVAITPTYSGCPALSAMRDDLVRRLRDAGFAQVRVRVELEPAWSTDHITERGRRALAEAGMSPPGPAATRSGTVVLDLLPRRRAVGCPRCGSAATELTSEFGPTACTAIYRCTACLEAFSHVKEL